MDLKGFGASYIVALTQEGYLQTVADFYTLADHRLELIEKGILGKEKNTDKLLAVVEASKDNDAAQLLTGFGIPSIGKNAARTLMAHYPGILALSEAAAEELTCVEDIGEVSAKAIVDFFANPTCKEILSRLQSYGVNLEARRPEAEGTSLAGSTFVITGTLPTMGRKEAEALILANGGKVTGSVSKKTTYLLAGENAGSKLDKANSLGISVLSEEDLLGLINNTRE